MTNKFKILSILIKLFNALRKGLKSLGKFIFGIISEIVKDDNQK